MIDHIEYEAFEGLKNNLSSKFGNFWLLHLKGVLGNIFIDLKNKVKISWVMGQMIRLISKSVKEQKSCVLKSLRYKIFVMGWI